MARSNQPRHGLRTDACSVGFVRTDRTREPMRVQASWVSDGEIARIAAFYARQHEEWTAVDEAAWCPDLTRRFISQPRLNSHG